MKNPIVLTLKFPESKTQTLILEKGSEAYKQMIDYAEINEGVTSEKPYLQPLEVNTIQVALDHLIEFLDDTMSDAIANNEESKHREKLEAAKSVREKLA